MFIDKQLFEHNRFKLWRLFPLRVKVMICSMLWKNIKHWKEVPKYFTLKNIFLVDIYLGFLSEANYRYYQNWSWFWTNQWQYIYTWTQTVKSNIWSVKRKGCSEYTVLLFKIAIIYHASTSCSIFFRERKYANQESKLYINNSFNVLMYYYKVNTPLLQDDKERFLSKFPSFSIIRGSKLTASPSYER